MFAGYLSQSLLKLAIHRQLVDVDLHNLRDWAKGKHKKVDDRPFGGGPGMVLSPQPVVECVEEVRSLGANPGHLVLLTPSGERLDQRAVERLGRHDRLLLLCGRYEGFDQRIVDLLEPQEVSIGDYILSGGEPAALVLLDAVVRLLPGVMGNETSGMEESFESGLLEHPHYTRPQTFEGLEIPDVLTSGNHRRIAEWRLAEAEKLTRERRPDLWSAYRKQKGQT